MDLYHFNLLRSVGKGAFGKVRVVQKKGEKDKIFALKYINKAKCIEMSAVDNIIAERNILETLEHPLIVNLRYAFVDDENMYMVLDLMLGGDIRYHLARKSILQAGKTPITEEVVRFWIAEVAIALSYLHKAGIVHRFNNCKNFSNL